MLIATLLLSNVAAEEKVTNQNDEQGIPCVLPEDVLNAQTVKDRARDKCGSFAPVGSSGITKLCVEAIRQIKTYIRKELHRTIAGYSITVGDTFDEVGLDERFDALNAGRVESIAFTMRAKYDYTGSALRLPDELSQLATRTYRLNLTTLQPEALELYTRFNTEVEGLECNSESAAIIHNQNPLLLMVPKIREFANACP